MLQGGGAYLNWVNSLLTDYPNLETASPMVANRLYPAAACEQQLTGKALIGVVAGTGGEILRGPEPLLATGYPVLDNAAIAAVREMTFDPSNSPKAYQIQFQFNAQENCRTVDNQTPKSPNPPATASPPPAQSSPPSSETQKPPTNPVEQKPPESTESTSPPSETPDPQPKSNSESGI
jgi:hypothetical protein